MRKGQVISALSALFFLASCDDAVLEQVAQAAALLSPELPDDEERKRAAAIALEFAVLSSDAIAADVQAAQRGMRSVTRRNANNVVQRANEVRIAMARDWRWPLEHEEEVARSIEKARMSRDEIFRWAPWAPVMNAGVTAANVSQMGVALGKLMLAGPAALERVVAWLKGPGSGGGVQWALAGEGGALTVSLVGRSGALVLTEAELLALVHAGQVSGLALQMIYLAKGHLHHIATDKNWISDSSGGPWSPRFESFFEGARLRLDDPVNLVEVEGHAGPHPRAYHESVFKELNDATAGLSPGTPEFREAVIRALRRLGKEIQMPGTRLNQLVTGGMRE